MNTFRLKLIAPDGVKYEQDASEATLPTPDGQITILPNHMPVISLLSPGEIVLKISGKDHVLATEGGIVEVANNTVKILADTAEDVASLDQLKIEEARKNAEERLSQAQDDVEYADAVTQLEKQLAKLNVIKRRKRRL
ncbi:MAG: ATP synthase F1 subunit epsilon [Patescibacteria group bacterium]|jgi:F-type H+-transporting ATPase subunit epsilon